MVEAVFEVRIDQDTRENDTQASRPADEHIDRESQRFPSLRCQVGRERTRVKVGYLGLASAFVLNDGEEQPFLPTEIQLDQSLGVTGLLGNGLGCGRFEATFAEDLGGRSNEGSFSGLAIAAPSDRRRDLRIACRDGLLLPSGSPTADSGYQRVRPRPPSAYKTHLRKELSLITMCSIS